MLVFSVGKNSSSIVIKSETATHYVKKGTQIEQISYTFSQTLFQPKTEKNVITKSAVYREQ